MRTPFPTTILLPLALCGGIVSGGEARAQVADGDAAALDEVVVTGSLIPRPNAASPVETLGRAELERRAVLDASALPSLTPANSGSEWQVDQLGQPQTSGTSQFNLRNLGLGSTLVLVDGRRSAVSAVAATDGSTFVDVGALVPLIALERIDILKDGASATYGSDAIAGVVNLITRRRADGVEARVRHAAADGTAETALEAVGGGRWLGGELVLAGAIFHRSSLGSDDRDFTQAATHDFAPWAAVTSYGQPGSYFRPSTGGFAPDPDCDDPAFDKAFRTSANDPFCRLDYSDFFDLAAGEDRGQAWASWRGALTPTVDLRLQAGWARTETTVRQSPSLPILAGSPVVPASHPDNPFGEDVGFRGRLLGAEAGASTADFAYDTRRAAAELDGGWGGGWRWNVAAAVSRQTAAYDKPDVIGSAFANALRGLGGRDCDPATGQPGQGGCLYFNPFGSAQLGTGTANPASLIEDLTGSTGLRGASSLATLDGLVAGPAAEGGWGALDVAVGAQARRSAFRQDWSDLANAGELLTAGLSPDFGGSQTAGAVFGEARLTLGDRLEAQVGARYEREAGTGSLSPKAAAALHLSDRLTLRASWAEGFRSPSVFVREGAQASQPSVFDGGAFVFVNTVTRGDPDLKPERSETWTLGAVWRPFEGALVSLDGWRFDYRDLVVKAPAQPLIDQARADDAAGLSGTEAQRRVQRDATGALSLVELDFINASSIATSGLDLAVRVERPTRRGTLWLSTQWVYVHSYEVRLTADAPPVSGVGSTNLSNIGRSLPRVRGEAEIGWAGDGWSLAALAHHVSGYRNDRAGITDPHIGSQLTFDVVGETALGPDLSVSLGVRNLADRDPPLAQFALGYDPMVADPRGRVVFVSLSRRF